MKTFEHIAPRTVPDRQTDRLTWVFIELLAAAKMHKAWMTCEALYRHYTKNSWSDVLFTFGIYAWWRHQMETFSALLAICAGNSPVTGEFPARRPVTRSFDVFFDLRPNKELSKQWSYSTDRKYSKPYLRTLGIVPRDTLPYVEISFDWAPTTNRKNGLTGEQLAVGKGSRSVSTGPSRMFSVLTEGCHVGYSREFVGTVYCTSRIRPMVRLVIWDAIVPIMTSP